MARVKLSDRIYDPADGKRVTTLAELAAEGRVEFTRCNSYSSRSASGSTVKYLAEFPETAKHYPDDHPHSPGGRESVSVYEISKAAYLSRTGQDVGAALS